MFGEPGTDMDRSEREGITTSEAFLAVSEWPRRRVFSETRRALAHRRGPGVEVPAFVL
jgi:hypothetical protein